MSHFYGTLQGHRGEATRCGSKAAGITVYAASWHGAICARVYHEDGKDCFAVGQERWHGAGISHGIASGVLGEVVRPKFDEPLLAGLQQRAQMDREALIAYVREHASRCEKARALLSQMGVYA